MRNIIDTTKSDGQSFNRLDFLTDADKAEREEMIEQAKASHFQAVQDSLNGRLLQARHTRAKLTDKVRYALNCGEDENSLYIGDLTNKIIVLIAQIEELEALAGQEGVKVA